MLGLLATYIYIYIYRKKAKKANDIMAAVVSFSTTNDLGNAAPPPDVLTYDFVVRSLRRRLWRAFQNDDAETALRAYQASKEEFQKWLQEEQELQTQRLLELEFASADAAAAAAASKVSPSYILIHHDE